MMKCFYVLHFSRFFFFLMLFSRKTPSLCQYFSSKTYVLFKNASFKSTTVTEGWLHSFLADAKSLFSYGPNLIHTSHRLTVKYDAKSDLWVPQAVGICVSSRKPTFVIAQYVTSFLSTPHFHNRFILNIIESII